VAVSDRSHADFPLADLYAVEREAGSAVQTNLVVIWVAATTYLIAAASALSVLADDKSRLDEFWIVLYLLPFPACALAGYHLILFGTGVVRSKSIEMVEAELKRRVTLSSSRHSEIDFDWKKYGSAAETGWNDPGKGPAAMLPVSFGALLVPYLSAIALVVYCFVLLTAHISRMSCAFIIPLLAYSSYGFFIAWLAVETFRKQGDSR
jgi:hypothetical protein